MNCWTKTRLKMKCCSTSRWTSLNPTNCSRNRRSKYPAEEVAVAVEVEVAVGAEEEAAAAVQLE